LRRTHRDAKLITGYQFGRFEMSRARQLRENMRAYRARMRAQGLRPVQLWVPDTRSPEAAAELRRQSLALAEDPAEREVLEFIEAARDDEGWS
jgi:Protein  of unknown function (DUF3018)